MEMKMESEHLEAELLPAHGPSAARPRRLEKPLSPDLLILQLLVRDLQADTVTAAAKACAAALFGDCRKLQCLKSWKEVPGGSNRLH